MSPENTPGLVATSDEAVHHHSPPSSSARIGHRDHKRKRRNDALPPHQELTAARSKIDAERGATEPATPTGGAHRSQRRALAAERTAGARAGGSSSKNDNASSPSVAPPPASSKAIRGKHSSSSSSFVIRGGGKQHPTAGSGSSPGGGSHSYYANSHASAAPSSSRRIIVKGPAAPPPPHPPAKATRPPSASAGPSAAAEPLKPDDGDEHFRRRGMEVFRELDVASQQEAVNSFVRQQSPPKGDGFSFWLTPAEAKDDLKYVYKMVEEARRRKEASGTGNLAGTDTS